MKASNRPHADQSHFLPDATALDDESAAAITPLHPDNSDETPDRRNAKRQVTVFQAARVRWRDTETLCLVRNISSKGMMAEFHSSIVEGEPLTIEFKVGPRINGKVIWKRKAAAGIEFEQPIDVAAILTPSDLAASRRRKLRRLRIEANNPAIIANNDRKMRTRLIDISPGGVKVRGPTFHEVGEVVGIAIDGLVRRSGTIRWHTAQQTGIAFDQPLTFEQIASCVNLRRDSE